jgi:equilibrative nucleoside transporter 1/2/3
LRSSDDHRYAILFSEICIFTFLEQLSLVVERYLDSDVLHLLGVRNLDRRECELHSQRSLSLLMTSNAWKTIPPIRVMLPLVSNTLLVTFLAATPHITLSSGLLFSLVLVNGALQAILGAYLQTSIVALASAFGPDAIASYMTGGALVAVGVSLLKLLTAYGSLLTPGIDSPNTGPDRASTLELHGGAAASGATAYFCIAAGFISSGIAAYAYLDPKIPRDSPLKEDTEVDQDESGAESDEPTEVDYLLGRGSRTPVPISSTSIWIVARKNACYNIAVFYVFVVTLVSLIGSMNRVS